MALLRRNRPCLLAAALLVLAANLPAARAETTVPLSMQVELLKRVLRFERGLLSRAGSQIALVIIVDASNARSAQAAIQLGHALDGLKELGGTPVMVTTHRFTDAAGLKQALGGAHVAYLTTGLAQRVPDIAAALAGLPVITISTDGDDVDRGAVLGFELVSAHPKIALNLAQARKQNLDFNSDLFRLARVVK